MIILLFKLFLLFFKKIIFNYIKIFFYKKGFLEIITNYKYYYNLLFFFNKSTFFQFKNLTDLVVIDYPTKLYRFLISYLINSNNLNFRLNLNFCIKELFFILSVKNIFFSSNWLEREVWDFYGIFFIFNNDLRRLILDYSFEGYPLKKEFPLYGYLELFFNQASNSLFYTNVQINKD